MRKRKYVILILNILIIYSIFKIVMIYSNYSKIENNISNLKEAVVSYDETSSSIDFNYLLNLNSDVVAWIKIPDTLIDEPVLQGATNELYLRTDIYKNYSIAGSIFIDERNSKKFDDELTIMYGHHMKNGTRFSDIKKFSDKIFFDEHEYIYLNLPDKTEYRYKITSFAMINSNDPIYNCNGTYDFYMQSIKNQSIHQREISKEQAPLLLLSTCVNATGEERYVLLGKLDN